MDTIRRIPPPLPPPPTIVVPRPDTLRELSDGHVQTLYTRAYNMARGYRVDWAARDALLYAYGAELQRRGYTVTDLMNMSNSF